MFLRVNSVHVSGFELSNDANQIMVSPALRNHLPWHAALDALQRLLPGWLDVASPAIESPLARDRWSSPSASTTEHCAAAWNQVCQPSFTAGSWRGRAELHRSSWCGALTGLSWRRIACCPTERRRLRWLGFKCNPSFLPFISVNS